MCFKKLPHPEEKKDESKTLENTHLNPVINKFYKDWQVKEPGYFDNINVILSLAYDCPACKVGEDIYIRPEWCNPGVLAHEFAHFVWHELNQFAFISDFLLSVNKEKLIEKLLKEKNYARGNYEVGNYIEVHAEVYRYLGEKMPQCLKKYYPHLV